MRIYIKNDQILGIHDNHQLLDDRYDYDAVYITDSLVDMEKPFSEQDIDVSNSAIRLRAEAYRVESDPLYLEWQYDGTAESEQVWRNKVADIKARYAK